MEFKEAMRTLKRMCDAQGECEKCELELNCPFATVPSDLDFDKAEATLAKWAEEHPAKTIMDDFFEKFPNAPRNRMDFPYPCAKDCGFPKPPHCDNKARICYECWQRPLEEV